MALGSTGAGGFDSTYAATFSHKPSHARLEADVHALGQCGLLQDRIEGRASWAVHRPVFGQGQVEEVATHVEARTSYGRRHGPNGVAHTEGIKFIDPRRLDGVSGEGLIGALCLRLEDAHPQARAREVHGQRHASTSGPDHDAVEDVRGARHRR